MLGFDLPIRPTPPRSDRYLREADSRCRRKPVVPDRTVDVVVGGLRTFAQRERFGRPGDVGGGYWAQVAHHPAAWAIAKGAELREPAMSLSKTANHPRNADEVRPRKHYTPGSVK